MKQGSVELRTAPEATLRKHSPRGCTCPKVLLWAMLSLLSQPFHCDFVLDSGSYRL